ncbi:MAG: hypothetical protein DMG17_11675 [Acidobacteria bacterium]|nr:MAG: hypothetical protein DMG17_11675 [Acidobacteriota bacterium]
MLVVNGIHLLENMKLDEIAARRLYEFALILEPLKIQGATGSTVAPIAIIELSKPVERRHSPAPPNPRAFQQESSSLTA